MKHKKSQNIVLAANPFSGKYLVVHAYIIGLSLVVNTLLYLLVTQPTISQYFVGSYLQYPDAPKVVEEVLQSEDSIYKKELTALRQQFSTVVDDLESVKSSLQEVPDVVVQQKVVERIVEKPVESESYQRRKSLGGGARKEQSLKGALLVEDENCSSGYSWLSPRLDRWCADESDFLE